MKRVCFVLGCLGLLSAFTLRAAETRFETRGSVNTDARITAHQSDIDKFHKASAIIGMKVKNANHENLGEVKDLMFDVQSGRIVYAVLGTGGFLGVGDKLLALPPTALNRSQDQKFLILNADRQALRDAPGFDRNNWPAVADTRWLDMSGGQYAERPMLRGEIRESAGAERDSARMKMETRDRDRGEWKPGLQQERKADVQINEPAGAERKSSAAVSSGESSGWVPGKGLREPSAEIETETTTSGAAVSKVEDRLMKAGSLMGMNVKNFHGQKLGEIEDIAVDLQAGRVLYVVMSDNGALGLRDRLYAVPLDALKRGAEANTMLLNADLDTLRQTAGFVKNDWPGQADSRFYGGLERHSQGAIARSETRIEESAGAERGAYKADTTTREPAVYSDRDLKKHIRQSVSSDSSFSSSARNVSVTVRNGKVTLRGTVNSTDERDRLISKAELMAGAGNVESQLKVKTNR